MKTPCGAGHKEADAEADAGESMKEAGWTDISRSRNWRGEAFRIRKLGGAMLTAILPKADGM